MLRAAPPGHPLQKPTVVQWDIGAMLSADGAADESASPQSGISRLPAVQCNPGIGRVAPRRRAAGYARSIGRWRLQEYNHLLR
jgi:hypothetical protein